MSDEKKIEKSLDDNFDSEKVSYTPSEVATYGLQAIEDIQKNAHRAISSGIPGLDGYLAPVRPGQVLGIVGQTSHYKSGLLHLIEHNAAMQLMRAGRDKEMVVHVSVEEGIEEQAFLEMARITGQSAGKIANGQIEDWAELERAAYKIADLPIYHIGDSLARSEYIPRLYFSNIFRAIRWLVDSTGFTPAMIGIDYLQALPIDPELKKYDFDNQRRLQVRSDAYRIRELASHFSCGVWVACQAKQLLSNSPFNTGPWLQIPGMYDINESADVSQRFDRLLGLWLPARTYPVGTLLPVGGGGLEVTPNLLFIKVNKQRGGYPAGKTFLYDIDFVRNKLSLRSLAGFAGNDNV